MYYECEQFLNKEQSTTFKNSLLLPALVGLLELEAVQQLPPLPGRDQFKSAHVGGLWVFLLEVDVPHHLLDLQLVGRGGLLVLGLDYLHLLLVGGLQAFGDQVLRHEFGDRHPPVVQLLTDVVDALHQHLPLLPLALELLLQLGGLQQFLLEVQLLVEVGLVVVDGGPGVVDPVPKCLQLQLRDGDFLYGGVLELAVLVGDEALQVANFALRVFDEGHEEGLELEVLVEEGEFVAEVAETEGDDGGHVEQFEGFALVGLLGVGLEDVVGEVVEEVLGGDEDVGGAVHPDRQHVEPQVDGVFVVVDSDPADEAALQEEGVAVHLSDVLDDHQYLGVDESELEGDVETDGEGEFVPCSVEVGDLFLLLLLLLHHGRLVVDPDGLLHPLVLELLDFLVGGDAGHLEPDAVAVDAAGQQFERVPEAEAEEVVDFWDDDADDIILLLFPQVVDLERTADDDVFLLELPHLLHVEVDHGYLGERGEEVVEGLREVLGVGQEHEGALLLVDELLERQQQQPQHLTRFRGGGEDDVVQVGFQFEQQLLEVGGREDLELPESLRDGGVVVEEL